MIIKSTRNLTRCLIVPFFLFCLAAAGMFAQEQKLVPIPLELPQPGYEGTPQNLKVTNLEKYAKRGPFLVPAGVVNVSRGKKVTSSDKDAPAEDLEMITDGDKTQAADNFVELSRGVQFITIDLGAVNEIYAVVVWHFYAPRAYFCTVAQIADDAGFTKNVQTIFSNDLENKTKTGVGKDLNYVEYFQGKLIDAKGARARYVRLYSNGNNVDALNNYIEVEVYGRPAK
jgi:hypothetical protein